MHPEREMQQSRGYACGTAAGHTGDSDKQAGEPDRRGGAQRELCARHKRAESKNYARCEPLLRANAAAGGAALRCELRTA